MAETQICQLCKSEIPAGAIKCARCGSETGWLASVQAAVYFILLGLGAWWLWSAFK
jgi:hypothetical protein